MRFASAWLEIEDQHRASRARTARRELVISGSLLVGLIQVAMLRLAIDYARKAGAANALRARRGNVDAVLRQGRDNGLVLCDAVHPPGARDLDLELGVVFRPPDVGREVLPVDAMLGPAILPGGCDHDVHEALGSAHVQVRVALRILEQPRNVKALLRCAVIEMEPHTLRERRSLDPLEKCSTLRGAGAVMHLELPSDVVEPLGHAEDGRDTDAAGEQKRSLGSLREGKVILGLADLEDI